MPYVGEGRAVGSVPRSYRQADDARLADVVGPGRRSDGTEPYEVVGSGIPVADLSREQLRRRR
ncbi:MAG: hypothetical protein ACRDWV_04115 [Acidimicrobiales bacterium]